MPAAMYSADVLRYSYYSNTAVLVGSYILHTWLDGCWLDGWLLLAGWLAGCCCAGCCSYSREATRILVAATQLRNKAKCRGQRVGWCTGLTNGAVGSWLLFEFKFGGNAVKVLTMRMRQQVDLLPAVCRRNIFILLALQTLLTSNICSLSTSTETSGSNQQDSKCIDLVPECSFFEQNGECAQRRQWMSVNCPRSCGLCTANVAGVDEADRSSGEWSRFIVNLQTASHVGRFRRSNNRAIVRPEHTSFPLRCSQTL